MGNINNLSSKTRRLLIICGVLAPFSKITANQNEIESIYSVKKFGAKGDGVNDDTSAINKAHECGELIFYPAGNYRCESVIINNGGIIGSGRGTVFSPLSDTDFVFKVKTAENTGGVVFRDFSIIGKKNFGSGIYFSGDVNGGYWVVDNVEFKNLEAGIKADSSGGFRISGCKFFFVRNFGIYLENKSRPDVGDSEITGCYFFNGNGPVYGGLGTFIHHKSGGGLRVLSNKFNGGLVAYHLDLNGTTSDVIFSGNSFEHQKNGSLLFENKKNSNSKHIRFANVTISGNQFARNGYDIKLSEISEYINSSYWEQIVIANNIFVYRGNGSSIEISSARVFLIQSNAFNGEGVGNESIRIGGGVTAGSVKNNIYYRIKEYL